MAFPNSPSDGDIYTDPNTNKVYTYNALNSIWKKKERSKLEDFTSVSGNISSPTLSQCLKAASSGTGYEPANSVVNNWQSRLQQFFPDYEPENFKNTFTYPGSVAVDSNDTNLIQFASPSPIRVYPEDSFYYRTQYVTGYSGLNPGDSPSSITYTRGNGFCFSFKCTEPEATNYSLSSMTIYGVVNAGLLLSHYASIVVVKGRVVDQIAIDSIATNSSVIQAGGKVMGKVWRARTGTWIGDEFSNKRYSVQGSYGDEYTVIAYNSMASPSGSEITVNDWTGVTPTLVRGMELLDTTVDPGIVYPAGYNAPSVISSAGGVLPFYFAMRTTNSESFVTARRPLMGVLDYYKGWKNQVPQDQKIQMVSNPVAPDFSQFIPQGYVIYNISTSALNYWDVNTGSWVAV